MRFRSILLSAIWIGTISQATSLPAAPPKLPLVPPEQVGMRSDRLAIIDELVASGIEDRRMPGCVIAIGRHGKLAFLKAYGDRQLEPTKIPMTVDTVFDMASITKPVATGTSVMIMVEQGKMRLRNRVSHYLPNFAVNDKDKITITQLLTHQGGLIPDNALSDYFDGKAKAFERIDALKTYVDPGTRFVYTDVGFIVLARIVEELTDQNIDEFSRENIFVPLGMTETGYCPDDSLKARAATTEQREEQWIQGEVHDPRAYEMDGIAGHAGLFSTAQDLAVYAQMMLQSGEYAGVRILSPLSVAKMTAARDVSGNLRALGWDKNSVYSSNRSELFSDLAYGHGGFTGTVLWIDPELDLFFIFLSNRVHPNGKGNINSLAGRIATIACSAIDDQTDAPSPLGVKTGLDRLCADECRILKGQRVGLITNHTGIDSNGTSNITRLQASSNVQLAALFSPEHGIAGRLDIASISDSTDENTGLKVFSLYGKTRQPTAAQLEEVDTLVFDIQDIGTRFYTYISTMGLAMQAAAGHGKRFVVLDRPNPINGVTVDGPVLDEGQESFVGFHGIPVRHGMTIGELAMMFREELNLDLDLHVVRMEDWRRDSYFDQTELIWIDPSPNMRNLNQAILYPGIGLLETTNLSVGRGTDTPFERFGAPWIKGADLAKALNAKKLAGVRFTPIRFQPDSSVYQGQVCEGVQISITDRDKIVPLDVGFQVALCLRELYSESWETDRYNRLLGDQQVLTMIQTGASPSTIRTAINAELSEFHPRRSRFLLYP